MNECKECGQEIYTDDICDACKALNEQIKQDIMEESYWQSNNPDEYGRW